MTRSEFNNLMAGLASTTHKKFTADEIEFWFNSLADIPDDALRAAFHRFVRTGDDWPSIAKIAALADEQSHGQHKTAGEAFEQLTAAVRRFGNYNPEQGVAALDPVTQQALRSCGGWMWACDLSRENRDHFAARFVRAYDAIIRREQQLRRTPESIRPRITDGTTTVTDQSRLRGALPTPTMGPSR